MQQLNLEDLSILLVEPSLAQAKIITRALQSAGIHHVEHSPGPEQALARMEKFHPDLVASAMYFDGMSGTEFLLTLRADHRFDATPFMLVSSEQKFEYLDPIKQAGVVAILPKPFGANELKVALLSTLNYLESTEVELGNFDIRHWLANIFAACSTIWGPSKLSRLRMARLPSNLCSRANSIW
jgi:two-component system chemotaxis response regulator CheY